MMIQTTFADQGGKVLSIPVEELMMDFLNKLFSKKRKEVRVSRLTTTRPSNH